MFAKPHPEGLKGSIADLRAQIAKEEAEMVLQSASLAESIRLQGRIAAIKFLADASRSEEMLPEDREELAKFLIDGEIGTAL